MIHSFLVQGYEERKPLLLRLCVCFFFSLKHQTHKKNNTHYYNFSWVKGEKVHFQTFHQKLINTLGKIFSHPQYSKQKLGKGNKHIEFFQIPNGFKKRKEKMMKSDICLRRTREGKRKKEKGKRTTFYKFRIVEKTSCNFCSRNPRYEKLQKNHRNPSCLKNQ